jgi:carbonic anhydrase
MACEAGSLQSPIDISMPRHSQQQERLVFHYQSGLVRALDNGHTIQVNVSPGNELHLNGRAYRLIQFHFHDPNEHHVDGRPYPMEIHLVHQDCKGHVVVIGVFVEKGSSNQSLAELWTMLPTKAGEQGPEYRFNPRTLVLQGTHHYSYRGFLTTPPCTEGVQWILLRDPILISAQHIAQFVSVVGHNTRSIRPCMVEMLWKSKSSCFANSTQTNCRTGLCGRFSIHSMPCVAPSKLKMLNFSPSDLANPQYAR